MNFLKILLKYMSIHIIEKKFPFCFNINMSNSFISRSLCVPKNLNKQLKHYFKWTPIIRR